MSETINVYTAYNHEPCSLGVDAYTRGHLWSDGVSYTTTTMKTTLHMRGRSGNDTCKFGRLADWGLFLKVMVNGTWSKQHSTTFNYCEWRSAGADWTYTFDRKYSTYTVPVKGSYAYYPFSTAVFHYTDIKYITVPAQPVIKPSAPTLSSVASVDYDKDIVINFTKDASGGRKGSFTKMWLQYAPSTSDWPSDYQLSSTGNSFTISASEIRKLFPNGEGGTLDLRAFQQNTYDGTNNESAWGSKYSIIVKPKPKFSITTPPSLTTQPATTHVQYATPLTLLWNSGQCQNGTYKNTVISFQLNSLSKNITTSTNKNGQININWNKLLTSKEWPSSSGTSLIIKSITNYTDNDAKAHQYTSQLTLTADPYVEPTRILSIKVQVPDTATAKKIWIKVPDNYKGPSPVKIKLE